MKESAILHKNFMRSSEVAGAIRGTYDSLQSHEVLALLRGIVAVC